MFAHSYSKTITDVLRWINVILLYSSILRCLQKQDDKRMLAGIRLRQFQATGSQVQRRYVIRIATVESARLSGHGVKTNRQEREVVADTGMYRSVREDGAARGRHAYLAFRMIQQLNRCAVLKPLFW